MKWFSRQSRSHGACLLSHEAPRLDSDSAGGIIGVRDWSTSVNGGGILSAATVKIGKELALLRAGREEQATQNRKRLFRQKARGASGNDCLLRYYRATEATKHLSRLEKKKSNTFGLLEESTVVSTIVWLPGTLCTASNLDSCVFSGEPSTKNEGAEAR